MNGILQKFVNKIYSSEIYESFISYQNHTVSKWQTNLLKIPAYWRWHSLKYYNVIHWVTLLSFAAGLFAGIMLPLSARKQPGRGQEIEIVPPSSMTSTLLAYPNLLTADGKDSAEIKLTLLDVNYNPLKRREVEFIAEGDGVKIERTQVSTSDNGIFYAKVSSTEPGIKRISVKDLESDLVLTKVTEVEFTTNAVKHWRVPGEISPEAATSAAVDVSGSYSLWTTTAVSGKEKVQEIALKKNLQSDSCIEIRNSLYCAGGIDQDNNITNAFYEVSLDDGEIDILTNLPYGVSGHKILNIGDVIYLIGGNLGESLTGLVYNYNFTNNSWVKVNNLDEPRENFGAVNIENELYVFGGYQGTNQTASLRKFQDEAWIALAPMKERRNFHGYANWKGRIYVFGGWDGKEVLGNSEVYIPEQNEWFSITPMPTARWGHSAIEFKDKIYIIGGYNTLNQPVSTIEIFDPNTNSWIPNDYKIEATEFSIAKTQDGILIVGGQQKPGSILQFTPKEYSILISKNENLRRSDNPSTQFEIFSASAEGKVIEREVNNLDLTNSTSLKFMIYSTETGDLMNFLIGESDIYENRIAFSIIRPQLWTEIELDISNIPAEDKNSIKHIGFEIIDASKPFKLNIYDIWTEGIFFTECPCEKEINNIFLKKDSAQTWGRISWAAEIKDTSTIEIYFRGAESTAELMNSVWGPIPQEMNLEAIGADFLELKAVLRDDEVEWLPNLLSVSVEVF